MDEAECVDHAAIGHCSRECFTTRIGVSGPPFCGVFDVEVAVFDAIEIPPRDGVFFQNFVFTYGAQLVFAR
eukprot:scaffold16490_cov99-Isochrysis_galbana.AAC.6